MDVLVLKPLLLVAENGLVIAADAGEVIAQNMFLLSVAPQLHRRQEARHTHLTGVQSLASVNFVMLVEMFGIRERFRT